MANFNIPELFKDGKMGIITIVQEIEYENDVHILNEMLTIEPIGKSENS